jgi:putative inorganic carbon (hco3(-)) transporter
MIASATRTAQRNTDSLRHVPARLAAGLAVLGLGAFLARAPLSWALLAVVGAPAALIILLRPMWGVYLLGFAIPFGSLRTIGVGGASVGAVEALTLGIFVAWLVRMVAQREIHLPWHPILAPLLALIYVMGLSLTVTTSISLSAKEMIKWVEVLLIALFLMGNLKHTSSKGLIIAFLLGATAQSLLGIYQFVLGVGPEGFILMGRFMRAYGTFRQPNPFAGYLGLHLPMAVGVLLVEWRGLWEGWRERDGLRLALAWVALGSAVIIGGGLIASWSRGGWLGAAAAAVAMVLATIRRALLATLALGAILALFLGMGGADLLPASIVQRATDALPYVAEIDIRTVEVDDNNWSVVERMAHWDAAWQMFSAHPWLGIGVGNYALAYPAYSLPRWSDPLGHAHNYLLNAMAEIGLIGLLTYLFFWGSVLVWILSGLREAQGYRRGLLLAALGIAVHLQVHNLVDNLYVHGMQIMVAIVLALCYLGTRPAEDTALRLDLEPS